MALSFNDLNELLHKAVPFRDTWVKEAYGPHNTRLNPKRRVERALYCVTPTPEVVNHFKEGGYDILLTHHPFIVGVPQWIAHTALDCTTGGLNDQWRDLYQVRNPKHFDGNLGWYGEIEPTSLQDLIAKAEQFVGAPLIGNHHGHEHTIKSIAICTGLGGMVERQAHKTGADCYIIGEAVSHAKHSHFKARIETGHTLSEHITGLNFFRKHLEPHGIIVDGSKLEHDKYSGEVYQAPVFRSYFSETGLPAPSMSRDKYKAKGAVVDVPFTPVGEQEFDPAQFDASQIESSSLYTPWTEDEPSMEELDRQWDQYERWREITQAPEPVKAGTVPKLDTSSRGTGIQGVAKIPDKPPMPPGGDFPEGSKDD